MDASSGAEDQITPEWCAHHFDHLSPQLGRELHETLAYQRANHPVAHSDEHGGFWAVTEYEDVLRVAQDWETFSSAERHHGARRPVVDAGHPRDGRPAAAPRVQAPHQRLVHAGRRRQAGAGHP